MGRSRPLSILYASIPSTLFVLVLSVGMLVMSRALETYDIRVVKKAARTEQVQFGRTPVVDIGASRYAVLGLRRDSNPRKSAVLMRNLHTNRVITVHQGQALRDGSRLAQIGERQLVFSKDSQIVIIGLPNPSRDRSIRRI